MTPTASQNFEIAPLLGSVFDGRTLTRDEARDVMGRLMDGQLSQMQAAALLAALRTRGETVDEVVGFAEAMRARAVKVTPVVDGPLLDTCGTGGTGFSSLNISTTAVFVAAADGVHVAKHGNRGVTKRSGSADVLEALGVRLEQSPERLAQSLQLTGVAFIYARTHHPSMKFVAPIRADLQARTIFNSLGPLTNPADATRQLMGVFAPELTRQLAQVLGGLGTERALVVYGDGLDDFTVSGESLVAELLLGGEVREYTVVPEDVGLARRPKEELAGGDPAANAVTTRAILSGDERGAKRDVVLFNAGAALYLADRAEDLREGVARASELVDSGAAAAKLDEFIEFSRS
ncbi:MAG: anthranilate phosphoribosyltransferase [Trueperaceae bacterium]